MDSDDLTSSVNYKAYYAGKIVQKRVFSSWMTQVRNKSFIHIVFHKFYLIFASQ